jgi:hypothetical protein
MPPQPPTTSWLALAAAILLAAGLTACTSSRRPVGGPSAPAPTAAVTATGTDAVPNPPVDKKDRAGAFAGTWFGHGRTLTIAGTGLGTLSWRTYANCGQDPPPCDTTIGNQIFNGADATVFLTSVGPTSASGRVLTSNTPDSLPVGGLSVRLDSGADLLYLTPNPFGPDAALCGPKAAAGACGA